MASFPHFTSSWCLFLISNSLCCCLILWLGLGTFPYVCWLVSNWLSSSLWNSPYVNVKLFWPRRRDYAHSRLPQIMGNFLLTFACYMKGNLPFASCHQACHMHGSVKKKYNRYDYCVCNYLHNWYTWCVLLVKLCNITPTVLFWTVCRHHDGRYGMQIHMKCHKHDANSHFAAYVQCGNI